MKQYTQTNRVLAAVSFLITLITYILTLQPSVPFWDCGEFSAASAWQQVPHPPGAPLFLIIARMFHMLPFGDPGWRINMVSAVSSAVTAALVYLIIVKIIERWRPMREDRSLMSYLPTFAGALIGALAFTWSDTQWFNSVESEVYAAGTTLIALMIWLMMRWNEVAEQRGHERYLLMIAYVTGLAFGIHLLALLVIPGVAMVIYFRTRKFEPMWFIVILGAAALIFYFAIYNFPLQYFPKLTATSPPAAIAVVLGLGGLLFWAIRTKKNILALSSASMLLILLGFTTYTHILLRANAHPPMNENEPDTMAELVSYLGREQYGHAPNWPRRYKAEEYHRNYQDKYGTWYPPTGQDPKTGELIFDRVNTSGELNFMFDYQIGQMYIRYLLWNFVGRVSDVQGAPATLGGVSAAEKASYITPTGYEDIFPITFYGLPFLLGLVGIFFHFRRDWKMALVFGALFLLLGLLATLQQNQQQPQPRERDYFYVGSYMIFAMWIGLGAAGLAETFGFTKRGNEPEGQAPQGEAKAGPMVGVLAACMLIAPLNMAINGWSVHDRSHNWVPWDYSYNILQSVEKDAIIFTNGDNDTFPLWYLQDVAGVRRDVRVVNLSLGQTEWYIWQLKHERPWNAKTVKLSFPDNKLKVPTGSPGGLTLERIQGQRVESIDIPAETVREATGNPSASAGVMRWQVRGDNYGERAYLGVNHQLVIDILKQNIADRPIYFCTSTGSDVWCGLEPFFRQEGLAYRIMPVEQSTNPRASEAMNVDVMRQCLMATLPEDVSYTDQHKYGFKFRNLNDPDNFFGEDHRRIMVNYRSMYVGLANYELRVSKDKARAIATLDKLESLIAPDRFGMPYPLAIQIANIYREAGAPHKGEKYALQAIDDMQHLAIDDRYRQHYPPELYLPQMLAVLGKYDQAIKSFQQLQSRYPGDPSVRAQLETMQIEKRLAQKDTAGAITEIDRILSAYASDSTAEGMMNASAFREMRLELTGQAPPLGRTVKDNTKAPGAVDEPPFVADSAAHRDSGGR